MSHTNLPTISLAFQGEARWALHAYGLKGAVMHRLIQRHKRA